ncbi:uncharacterized protein LOC116340225 [Contarinia nasturtii]|uniref:uncharacterized protein LOC116340225 n=1 Tax=Contarinia nasturtii TaxID=265458 RepID=UPI0012D409CB|nr:uncharacterized protein LOC116340225 [Contarinia nasturtii]
MAKRRGPKIFGGVPRKKAKQEEKKKKEENVEKRTRKVPANSIFRDEYADYLVGHFYGECLKVSKISYLASLLLLYKVNEAFDNDDHDYFITTNGKKEIRKIFTAVARIDGEFTNQMPDEFKEMVEELTNNEFEWPSRDLMGNAFEYMHQQYLSNVTTQHTTHCEKELAYFLQMKRYQFNQEPYRLFKFDDIDIRNAIESIMRNKDWSEGDPVRKFKMNELFVAVKERCLPSFGDYLTMTQYIEKKWFESLYFFIQIQREISEFKAEHQQLVHAWLRHKKKPLLFEKPTQPLPPKIRNITVVPLCDNKLKHIRFDHKDLLALLARWKLIPEEFA